MGAIITEASLISTVCLSTGFPKLFYGFYQPVAAETISCRNKSTTCN